MFATKIQLQLDALRERYRLVGQGAELSVPPSARPQRLPPTDAATAGGGDIPTRAAPTDKGLAVQVEQVDLLGRKPKGRK